MVFYVFLKESAVDFENIFEKKGGINRLRK